MRDHETGPSCLSLDSFSKMSGDKLFYSFCQSDQFSDKTSGGTSMRHVISKFRSRDDED
jgi:hypothetical protein